MTRPFSPPASPGSVGKLHARERGRARGQGWDRGHAGLRRAARERLRQGRAEALGAGREPRAAVRAGARRHREARPAGRGGVQGDETDRGERAAARGGHQEAEGHDAGREGADRLARRVLPLLLQRARRGGQAVLGRSPRGVRDHARPGEAVARERRGARDAHGRAGVRRAAVPDRRRGTESGRSNARLRGSSGHRACRNKC